MTSNFPILIPQPRHFEWQAGAFDLNTAAVIVLGLNADETHLFPARQLQTAIQTACGFNVAIIKTASLHAQPNAIRLELIKGEAGDPTRDASMGNVTFRKEGYHLAIRSDGVAITAGDAAGLFYGVQTLIQLLRTYGRRIPACRCDDHPALPHRGVMLDVSRGKVPTRATLERLADVLAHYKINQLQLYTEHTFRFRSHPKIGATTGALSADDILALDEVCRACHIELVPNLQSTGHMRHILSLPEYEHLAETPWRWSITPALDETYRFLEELYADFLPAFSAPILNVNSDEAWDHGRGQAQALSTEIGYGRVYLNHILKLREIAAHHGRRIMIWADILHHYPELLPEIPPDMTLLDWNYEAQPLYPTLEPLARAERPFYVCPGTSTWNTIFPRIDNSLINIRNYVRDGLAAGAIGMLLTDWGDMGHYQPLSHSWYSYLFGAEMAWTGATTPTDVFDQAFGEVFLGDTSGRAVAAMRRLGRAVEQPGFAAPNRSDTVYALYEEPLLGRMVQTAPAEELAELIVAAESALRAFAMLSDAALRYELSFSAHQIIFAASKVQLGQTIRATLRDLADSNDRTSDGGDRLDARIGELEQLRAALPPMVAEFEQIWLRSAHRSEIESNLDRYAALLARFDAAIAWLHQQRESYAATGTVDAELLTYDPGDYLVLWDQGVRDLHHLVDLVGRDAAPPEILRWLGLEQ
jgi:hypothetical protein